MAGLSRTCSAHTIYILVGPDMIFKVELEAFFLSIINNVRTYLILSCFIGNPRVTPEVTRDVCLLARMMAANLYFSQIEDLMFEVL